MEKSNRRHSVMINRKFQIQLILKFIALNILIMLLFGLFMYLFLDNEIQGNFRSARVTYKNVKAMLFPIVVTLSILNILFTSILTAAFVLIASFRIAGPIYRFNQALTEIAQGKLLPYTAIREKDQLYECSKSLNALSQNIASSFEQLRGLTLEAEELAKSEGSKELRTKLEEIKKILEKYEIK
jgi:HAMP domain-containing protein